VIKSGLHAFRIYTVRCDTRHGTGKRGGGGGGGGKEAELILVLLIRPCLKLDVVKTKQLNILKK
jgi:hypothetical protein